MNQKVWQYNRGDWVEVENPFAHSPATDEHSPIYNAGYRFTPGFIKNATRDRETLWISKATPESPFASLWLYVVEDDLITEETILITDTPSLLMFLKDYLTVFWAADTEPSEDDEDEDDEPHVCKSYPSSEPPTRSEIQRGH